MRFAPFLKAFAATILACLGGAAGLVASTGADLPAPHLSRSASFNEKAGWLRGALASGRCDVLVVGSSMALNNVAASRLAGTGHSVINIGSFGVNPEDTLELLRIVTARCAPRLIVMATYQGDFASDMPDDKTIAWPALRAYLSGGSTLAAWAADFDPYYLLKRSLMTSERHKTDTYQSVAFDPSGSVGLDCERFHVEPRRWDGDQIEHMPAPRQAAIAATREIAAFARGIGAGFVVAVAPLRPRAERSFYPAERARLWERVRQAVEGGGGIFLRPAENASFTDRDFVDYAHLSRCGAERWTDLLARAIPPVAGSPAP